MIPIEPDRLRTALAAVRLRPTGDPVFEAAGWESQIWRCETSGGPIAVRIYAEGIHPDRGAREAITMRLLERAGYPAPIVFHFEPDPALVGSPFLVMDHLGGGTLAETGMDPSEIGRRTANLLRELHQLPIESFDHVSPDPLEWVHWANAQASEAFPGFTPVTDWITERLEEIESDVAAAHLDFHPKNILLDDDGDEWVIDWTSFRLTDPRFDVATTKLLGSMFAGDDFTASFTARYQELAGPLTDMDFFEVVAAVRRLADALWVLSPDNVDGVQSQEEIFETVPALRIPADWVRIHTGIAIGEIEALLDSVE